VDVLLKDGEYLVQQLLLMKVVKLKDGIHLVDNGMFVNKLWELAHDSGDKVSVVGEADMDVVARNNLSQMVHAHVEPGIDTVDFDVSNRV
jgi:hypothetical protein